MASSHAANGYLPDQFRQDGTNKRTDEYAGPIENRVRFLLKVTQAAVSVRGSDRVGVRISPSGTYGSMSDSNPPATFGYVATQLDRLGIASLHVVEPRIGTEEIARGQVPIAAQHLRPKFSRTLIAAGGCFGRGHRHLRLRRSSPFAATLSQIRICPSGGCVVSRSTATTGRPSTAAMRAATRITRPPRPQCRPDRSPARFISPMARAHHRPSLAYSCPLYQLRSPLPDSSPRKPPALRKYPGPTAAASCATAPE